MLVFFLQLAGSVVGQAQSAPDPVGHCDLLCVGIANLISDPSHVLG